jgi:CIC family chloride channel protein
VADPREPPNPLDAAQSAAGGVSVAPALESELPVRAPEAKRALEPRALWICVLAALVAAAAALVARGLTWLIAVITAISFHGNLVTPSSPATSHLGLLVILVPVAGGLIVGLLARFGSEAIRGHGIPEAMEQVLVNESRIPARLTILKPLSAAIAIGTGGPFGAEGPIIATGGALGSLVGQLLPSTASERKTLLAAGAAAGMAATFGCPVAAVLLAVELLLFELRPRSLVPVSIAAVVATAVRTALGGGGAPMFAMPALAAPGSGAIACYLGLGALVGVAAAWVTQLTYAVEDRFARLPVHWMWWPAIGAIAVGVCGFVMPRTLGVGYDNITAILSGNLGLGFLAALFLVKLVSWSISLGSGTSGGTLAPLLTIGGGLGAVTGAGLAWAFPGFGIDPRLAALVGMASMFAGASRAFLASVVFALETTGRPEALLPLLGGCAASYTVSFFLMRESIMTEKIVRRGVRVLPEYAIDWLAQVSVSELELRPPVALASSTSVEEARRWCASGAPGSSHQGWPVVDAAGRLAGVVTRRDLSDRRHAPDAPIGSLLRRRPVVVYEDSSLREAADRMVVEDIGRLPVVRRDDPRRLVGFLTRSDLLSAHRRRLLEESKRRSVPFAFGRRRARRHADA